jgi:L-asparaginase
MTTPGDRTNGPAGRRPSVYVVHTGGTIGMRRTADGFAPQPGHLAELMSTLPQLTHEDVPSFQVGEQDTLLDSANMTPRDWNRIADDIAANYDRFDGFVVLHGTDTMAYTASALSFMLEGLAKPVILTGSQVPLSEARSDALDNLITSLIIAGTFDVPEVCLCFHGKLIRGNRSTKADSVGFDAFDSANHPLLGTIGSEIDIDAANVLPRDPRPFRVQHCDSSSVGALRLFPGISADVVRNILRPPLKGLVLEAYGMGNAPTTDRAFVDAFAEATARGVVVVVVTQCVRGHVDLGSYAPGSAIARAGAVGGHDMTAEAALAKLSYLFSQGLAHEDVKAKMGQNLRGELSTDGP